jgi:uncharacterized repeat protein (TIGR03803 family)
MKKSILFFPVFMLLLLVQVSAQHEYYGTGAYTYPNSVQHGGQLFKIDSLGRNIHDPAHPYTPGIFSLHDFDSITGANPLTSVIEATNGKLYGTTFYGGAYNKGVLFEYDPVIDSYMVKQQLQYAIADPLMQASDGMLYFASSGVGSYIQKYDISTNTLTNVYYISYPEFAVGSLVEANGKLYGLTQFGGGPGNNGRVFEYNLNTSAMSFVHNFNCNTEGCQPMGRMVKAQNGLMYGVLRSQVGNASNGGSIFRFNPVSHAVTHLVNIPDSIGYSIFLTVGANNKLYGTGIKGTDATGAHNGSIFEYDPTGNTIRLTHNFGQQIDGTYTGITPLGGLLLASNGKMYGTNFVIAYEYDYLIDSVKMTTVAIGQTSNSRGILCEICRKPSYHYFPSDTVLLNVNDPFSFTIHSDNAVSYAWQKDGSPIPSQTDSMLHFSSVAAADSGTYSCIMSNWCGATTVIGTIRIEVNASATGLVTIGKQNNITLFPNPADDLLNIGFPAGTGNAVLFVFDALGKLQLQKKVGENTKEMQLNTGSLPEGIYFVKVSTGYSVYNLRFVVSR